MLPPFAMVVTEAPTAARFGFSFNHPQKVSKL